MEGSAHLSATPATTTALSPSETTTTTTTTVSSPALGGKVRLSHARWVEGRAAHGSSAFQFMCFLSLLFGQGPKSSPWTSPLSLEFIFNQETIKH